MQSVTGIKFFVLKGSYAKQIENEFDKVMDEGSPAYGTIAKWVSVFKRGEMSIEDARRYPVTSTTDEIVSAVERIVTEDPVAAMCNCDVERFENHD